MSESAKPETTLARILFFIKFLEIRLRFVILLVLTALVVGYWDNIQNYWERWTRAPRAGEAEADIEYFCGMHPFVVSDRPGKCPICGMDLTRREKGERKTPSADALPRVQVSPERIRQAGVQIEPVSYRPLVRTVEAYGIVETDETRVRRIIARFPGRVEELVVNAVGMTVKRDEPLLRIYSPQYIAAAQEYAQAVATANRLKNSAQGTPESLRLADAVVVNSRRMLSLAGFTDTQLDEIARTGQVGDRITLHAPLDGTVMEKNVLLGDSLMDGASLYTLADLSVLWVQAQILESDVGLVREGMAVQIESVAFPQEYFFGTVNLIYPSLDTGNRAVKARVVVDNKEGKLKPGMFVTVTLRTPMGRYGIIGSPGEPKMGSDDKAMAATGQYPLDYCVISGSKLGGMGDPVKVKINGRDVEFCCEACIPKFQKEPEKYFKLIEEAAARLKHDPGRTRWSEGYACAMHLDRLAPSAGVCAVCPCAMRMEHWRVERVLSVPEVAVIDTGRRQYVFVQNEPGLFDARLVKLGPRSGEFYPVLEGLALGETIVSRGSFLIDAEARLNPSGFIEPEGQKSVPKPAEEKSPEAAPAPAVGTTHQH